MRISDHYAKHTCGSRGQQQRNAKRQRKQLRTIKTIIDKGKYGVNRFVYNFCFNNAILMKFRKKVDNHKMLSLANYFYTFLKRMGVISEIRWGPMGMWDPKNLKILLLNKLRTT